MTGRPARRRVPLPIRALAVVTVLGLGLLAWSIAISGSPERRAAAARDLAAGIDVSVGVAGSSLAATLAVADFGIDEGVRLVPVRILEQVQLEVRLRSAAEVTLAGPPRICFVGPHWAPDDAGLSDRCWGSPDLGALVAAQLPVDADGQARLAAGQPLEIVATIERGHERCDYPVGTWALEVTVEPLVDGRADGPIELPVTPVEIPLEPEGTALRLVGRQDARYCGLAQSVWREQGDPTLLDP